MPKSVDKSKMEDYYDQYGGKTRSKGEKQYRSKNSKHFESEKLPFEVWGCDTEGTRENEYTGKQSLFRFGVIAFDKDDYFKFSNPVKFWDKVLSTDDKSLYIVFYNLNWDFVYLYPYMPEFDISPVINWFSHPSFIKIKRKTDEQKTQFIIITDLANYFPREGESSELWEKQKLDNISKSFLSPEYRKMDVKEYYPIWNTWCMINNPDAVKYCFYDGLICKLVLEKIFNYFNARGISISGITGKWLKRLLDIDIKRPKYVINNFEIPSYRGGIANVYDFSYPLKKVFNFDVNAMYHSVMANNSLPYRYNHKLTGEELKNFSVSINDSHAYLCRAYVEIFHPCLSIVDNAGGMLQPVGTFSGIYWNNLLNFIQENNLGNIRKITHIEQYDLTSQHQPDLLRMWSERLIAQEQKDKLKEMFIKSSTNTSYGKLGEKMRITKILNRKQVLELIDEINENDDVDYSEEHEVYGNVETRLWKIQKFGNYYYLKRKIERREAWGAFTAGASYITSKAQEILLNYKKWCGFKDIFCDTDSLKVPAQYYHRLEKFVNLKRLGGLKIEFDEKPSYIMPFAPKAYMLFFGNEIQFDKKPDNQTIIDLLNDKNPNIVKRIKGFPPDTIFKENEKGEIIGDTKHVLKYRESIKRRMKANVFIRQPRVLRTEKNFTKAWVDQEGNVSPLELENGKLIVSDSYKNYVNFNHVLKRWIGKIIFESIGEIDHARINN